MKKNITIIGAGLVGSLLGIYLRKRGYAVSIYEKRADMRLQQMSAGRSINLALSDRGIVALQEVGILKEVLDIAIPMPGRFIHNVDGSSTLQPYGKEGQAINSVSRGELNAKLMNLAEENQVKIFFNHACENIDWNSNSIQFCKEESNEKVVVKSDIIFAADGAFSAARLSHMLSHNKFDYQQYYIDCGYKELTIPAGENNSFKIDKNALHIWPRNEFMLIALPNMDGSFTCTLFFPFEGELSFEKLKTNDEVERFFNNTFPDVVQLIPDVTQQYFANPTSSLVTVKCYPWVRNNSFCLIGDAAHAVVPFYGQGMNCGFEDCAVLNNLLDVYKDDWDVALEKFQELRKIDADAIADMAIDNFTEMRAKVANPKFLLQKKIETKLHAKYSSLWIPQYSQVTFSPHIRYSEAKKNGVKQDKIMQEIMQIQNIETIWDSSEIEDLILQKLKS